MSRKVMIALNTAWNLYNFRSGLIRGLVAEGYEVVVVAPHDEYAERLGALGCRYVPLPMDNQGTNPARDLFLLWRFVRVLQQERPDIFLGYTIKPNVYGSVAAHLCNIPVINSIAGLGVGFSKDNWLRRVVCALYRFALADSRRVFFHNADDMQLFVTEGLVKAGIAERMPGSGINLATFHPAPLPTASNGPLRFLLVARMLWDKGVGEYVEAARIVRRHHPDVEFCLLGFLDVKNPAAISNEQIREWVAEGAVTYLGVTDDVRPSLASVDCVVLPSYREGVPRTLLEAAAMGRPLVTTDTVGCRDVVDDGVNGFLCRVRDAADLAEKLERIVRMSPDDRAAMGRSGRAKVEREFSERRVVMRYVETIEAILRERDGKSQSV